MYLLEFSVNRDHSIGKGKVTHCLRARVNYLFLLIPFWECSNPAFGVGTGLGVDQYRRVVGRGKFGVLVLCGGFLGIIVLSSPRLRCNQTAV